MIFYKQGTDGQNFDEKDKKYRLEKFLTELNKGKSTTIKFGNNNVTFTKEGQLYTTMNGGNLFPQGREGYTSSDIMKIVSQTYGGKRRKTQKRRKTKKNKRKIKKRKTYRRRR